MVKDCCVFSFAWFFPSDFYPVSQCSVVLALSAGFPLNFFWCKACWANGVSWCSGCLTDWKRSRISALCFLPVTLLWASSRIRFALFFSPGVSQLRLIFTQQTAVTAGPFLIDCCLFSFSFCYCASDISFWCSALHLSLLNFKFDVQCIKIN